MASGPVSFQKDRYCLELVDYILVQKPYVVRLDEPTFSIGITGGNSWNLPLDDMGLGYLKTLVSSRVRLGWSILTLRFRESDGSWYANDDLLSKGRAACYVRDVTDDEESKRDFRRVRPGSIVNVNLTAGRVELDCPGSILFKLVDNAQPGSSSNRIASLPAVPLGMVASNLTPYQVVRRLCSIDPLVAQKLMTLGVSWTDLKFLKLKPREVWNWGDPMSLPTVLDCVRALKLVREESQVTVFHMGAPAESLDPEQEAGFKTESQSFVFDLCRKFVYAQNLQELHLDVAWLNHISSCTLPASLKEVGIHHDGGRSFRNCRQFWARLSEVQFSPTSATKVQVIFPDNERSSPAVCHRHHVAHPQPQEIGAMPRVTRVSSWQHCPCGFTLPYQHLVNLESLEMNLDDRWCHYTHRTAVLLNLRDLDVSSETAELTRAHLEAFAQAAPNLESITFSYTKEMNSSQAAVRCLEESVGEIGSFMHLRSLSFSFYDCLEESALEPLLRFCLAVPRRVSTITIESVECHNVAAEGTELVAGQLEDRGRTVTLKKTSSRPSSSLDVVRLPCHLDDDSNDLYHYILIVS